MSLAAVWIDNKQARIFHVHPESFDESTVHAPHREVHRHPKREGGDTNHPQDEQHFYRDIARALADAKEILLVGPSTAKFHFLKYAHQHERALVARIVGVETIDHPTDRQIAAHVRRYLATRATLVRTVRPDAGSV